MKKPEKKESLQKAFCWLTTAAGRLTYNYAATKFMHSQPCYNTA
ncbi:MAG: hypothetical protein PHH43_06270 [Candidatus Cloacimonetes bacterium]|nr:hypothetical protein [Candidatus Cloacimonadota bacterium]